MTGEKDKAKIRISTASWERRWKEYWKNAGQAKYELPADDDDPVEDERYFLVGSPDHGKRDGPSEADYNRI
jgi:hypothetical protein